MSIRVTIEHKGETWTAEVNFAAMVRGPQHDWTRARVTRDGERVIGESDGAVPAEIRWTNSCGGEPRDWALVDNGCLWAPGIMNRRPRTAEALAKLTHAIQRAAWAKRGPGRATKRERAVA